MIVEQRCTMGEQRKMSKMHVRQMEEMKKQMIEEMTQHKEDPDLNIRIF